MIDFDYPEAEYHRHPALSATGAKLILDSPAKFNYRINQQHPERKAVFDLGAAVHAEVLGTGWGIEELDFPDFRTKAAQQARDEAYTAGLIPMLSKDLDGVKAVSDSVLAHPTARMLFEQDGHAEVSVFAEDEQGTQLRCRFDFLPDDHRVAVDLKTTSKKADARGFASSAASYGYDVQEGHYIDTLKYATGDVAAMVFVVVEVEPPYLVGVHQLDRDFRDMGHVKAAVARDRFRRCTDADEWPGYPTEIQLVQPPVWATYDYQDNYGGS